MTNRCNPPLSVGMELQKDGGGFDFAVYFDASGDRIIISSIWNDGNGVESGHARVYDWDGLGWNQIGSDIDERQAGTCMSGFTVKHQSAKSF
jgi:hypothetical protein